MDPSPAADVSLAAASEPVGGLVRPWHIPMTGRAAWLIHPQSATRPTATPLAISVLLLTVSALSAPWIGVPLAVVAMGVVLGGLVAVNVRAMQVVPS